MSQSFAVGIDVGTHNVKVAVAEKAVRGNKVVPKLAATGYAESKGLRYGYIVNSSETTRSVRKAVRQAERTIGSDIKRAYLAIGGVSLEGTLSQGSTVVSRADLEITEEDIQRALDACERTLPRAFVLNKKILHTVPITFKVDGREVLGRPHGMRGSKLEVKALFITCLEQHLNDIIEAVENAGIEVEDVIAAPIAASFVSLTKTQKIAGCVLANVGAETVSVIVYENNIPISLEIFPYGSNNITKDIALGLQIPLDDAEKIKLGNPTNSSVTIRKDDVSNIIKNRLEDIFQLIASHLQKIEKNELLPAGIIITGGGSGTPAIADLARSSLSLPSMISKNEFLETGRSSIKDATWSVAYGLCILSFSTEGEKKPGLTRITGVFKRLIEWIRRILP